MTRCRRPSSSTPSTGSCARSAGCSTARSAASCSSRGPDAAEYLQGQLTNDVEALRPARASYAALLDRKGHMQADMRVLRLGRGRRSGSTPSPRRSRPPGATSRCTRSAARSRSTDVSAERAILSLIGPAQRRDRRHRGPAPSTPASAPTVGGVECLAVGTADGDRPDRRRRRSRAACATALLAAGAVEVDPEAAEIVRIEAGRPRFGAEMSTATMPAEAGIVERAVSFTKGCYIGQEPVARLHYKGSPNRHLRGLRLSAPAEPGDGAAARREGGRRGRQRLRLPRPRPDRAGDRPPRGRARRRARRR